MKTTNYKTMKYPQRYVKSTDPDFPERLRQDCIRAKPSGLYLVGRFPDPRKKAVAIIGARACTEYGRSEARRFGRILAESGVEIISGMAAGIDSAAQEGALEGGGNTYAVLGCGADVCYPASSRNLYERIAEGNGGILSEYPPGAKPLAYHFPIRNRLISGLADLVLVIEARRKSGSLLTVNDALEQGRDVFALPGRSTDPLSEGCNSLIEDGAMIAFDPAQILAALGLAERNRRNKDLTLEFSGDPDSEKVYGILDTEGMSVGQITLLSGLPADRSAEILVRLVSDGFAAELEPGRFVKRTIRIRQSNHFR